MGKVGKGDTTQMAACPFEEAPPTWVVMWPHKTGDLKYSLTGKDKSSPTALSQWERDFLEIIWSPSARSWKSTIITV